MAHGGLLDIEIFRLRFRIRQYVNRLSTSRSIIHTVSSVNVFAQTTHFINCNVLQAFINIFFCLSMATASGLFVLRTIALWRRNKWVIGVLTVLCMGQWGLFIYNSTILGVGWSDEIGTCLVETSDITTYKAIFSYSELVRMDRHPEY
jgi:hypothetical protein